MASQRPAANLSAIAAALGVSGATVSNALSGKGRVSAELTEKIRKKAAELGYVPSSAGRALRTGRSGVLGLVLPDIANPLFPQIAQAIEQAAADAGYGVLIADSHGDVAKQTEAINRLIERGVEGMIVVPRRGTRIADVDCPVAVIDSPSTPGNTVAADHWGGGQAIGRHLAGLGHEKVVIIAKNPDSNVQNDRVGGIRAGLSASAKTETLWIAPLEQREGAGCRLGVADKVAQGFTAFAAVSDLHALRVLTELQQEGISVPEQASVTGFDDLIWAPVVTPALTTIRMDMARIADTAITALVRVIDGEDPPDRSASGGVVADISKVAMELIIRRSTASNNQKQNEDKTSTAGELTS
ncbi:LacI family DNA-binding transcriptional regulator [Agrobacterium larrymoorei]|uniref:LacI family DNA-binding transcriptional regulator n=1 Tax=Agrobacterium larrymoorei TaxID=160699 RepID=A0A4D7DZ07_9HYPH|nr:LacI family DNA-binding transcriptional regulator [Agrobacterium larrymoorei]QCJ00140.1 LacI family transcriptional regulator [Agrobacterium larrymoorei]QYA09417.1 LacI family DNA-binding transcriptional regulator [Agrobacterium larrymoorei]